MAEHLVNIRQPHAQHVKHVHQYAQGHYSFMDSIRSGCDLFVTMTEMSKCMLRPSTVDIFSGAVSCLLSCYLGLRDIGLASKFEDPELEAFMQSGAAKMAATLMQSINLGEVRAGIQLSALASVVTQYRSKLEFEEALPPPPLDAPAKPLAVCVVGMPQRVLTMQVHRDENCEISGSTTTEVDAA